MLDQFVSTLFTLLTAANATSVRDQTANSIVALLQSDFVAAGTTATKEDIAASHFVANGSLFLLLFAFALVIIIGLGQTQSFRRGT
jgi:hypothetical protein